AAGARTDSARRGTVRSCPGLATTGYGSTPAASCASRRAPRPPIRTVPWSAARAAARHVHRGVSSHDDGSAVPRRQRLVGGPGLGGKAPGRLTARHEEYVVAAIAIGDAVFVELSIAVLPR